MKTLKLRKARKAARQVLEQLGLDGVAPVPVEDIARALGVDVIDGELDGALAALVTVEGQARIRVSNQHTLPQQRRFTIAHELGHFVLAHTSAAVHVDADAARVCDAMQEAEANAFASEILMPEPLARAHCEVSPVSLDALRPITEAFAVSLPAAAIRFAELSPERCAAVLCQQSRVRWAVRSDTFWPEIKRDTPLIPWSVAAGYFARGAVSPDCEPVDASAWVSGEHLRGEAEIFEHATVLTDLRAVLSLVWIPESCRALAWRER